MSQVPTVPERPSRPRPATWALALLAPALAVLALYVVAAQFLPDKSAVAGQESPQKDGKDAKTDKAEKPDPDDVPRKVRRRSWTAAPAG